MRLSLCLAVFVCFVQPNQCLAYEEDVHFSLTMAIAEMAGIPRNAAFEIAKFDQATDDDPSTDPEPRPYTSGSEQMRSLGARRDFHFITGDRLSQLKIATADCIVGNVPFKAIGQYFHALQDSYAHLGFGPITGHARRGHTPDKPWTQPANFRDMFTRISAEMSTVASRCFGIRNEPTDRQRRRALALLAVNQWVGAENRSGPGDPTVGGPEHRWTDLQRQAYQTDFDEYTIIAKEAYDRWVAEQRSGPWKQS